MKPILHETAILSVVHGTHGSPYDVLGMHATGAEMPGTVARSYQPYAQRVELLEKEGGAAHEMARIHNDGLFEVFFPDRAPFAYRLRMTGYDGHQWELEDPYRFPLQITDFDLYLFGEGTHFRTYEKMGAHPMTIDGVEGVHFAVWAPNAVRVSVIGWFNRWDGRHHPMQHRGSSGLWEIFLPALQPGDLYKFEIKGHHGFLAQKADPYAFFSELRPRSASVVWNLHRHEWKDAEWLERRRRANWHESPISVYELHPGSWKRVPEEGHRMLTYREMADQLIPYVKGLGYTHIEMLPISEHPFDGSWGYQTIGYYAPTSRFGNPDDFMYFVDRCHQEGIGVLLDWVPAHFPKDGHGLAFFDGSHLYEHADPRKGEHRDWGTLIFNYGRNEVRTFLLANALYWADVYHIDGLRVDAVASMLYLDYSRKEGEWIPNQFGGRENLEAVDFLKKFNEVIHAEFPGFLTFAEESTAWPMVSRPTYLGGLGFDFKWNMGWMHDMLEYITKEPVHRKYHHNDITFSLLYAFTENFILPFSHDEVVHGKRAMLDKMPGDLWQKFANLRLLYAYMHAHPGKKLLFMGGEFGQWREWNHADSLDWHLCEYDSHRKLQTFVGTLNKLYRDFGALHQVDFSWEGFEWIDFHDWEQSIVSFFRRGKDPRDILVCIFNFTPVPRQGYRVGVPLPGVYEEVLNTDADCFGGSHVVNVHTLNTDEIPWMGRPWSVPLTLPPLGAVWLRLIS
ncbi:MAG: 1,4-alpha-glucan branching protein GlgB [Kiritimatiellae bacterium]|nr:1,4-alpha-glucan branching protein GlgB [Kiritimatiellia bacterium]